MTSCPVTHGLPVSHAVLVMKPKKLLCRVFYLDRAWNHTLQPWPTLSLSRAFLREGNQASQCWSWSCAGQSPTRWVRCLEAAPRVMPRPMQPGSSSYAASAAAARPPKPTPPLPPPSLASLTPTVIFLYSKTFLRALVYCCSLLSLWHVLCTLMSRYGCDVSVLLIFVSPTISRKPYASLRSFSGLLCLLPQILGMLHAQRTCSSWVRWQQMFLGVEQAHRCLTMPWPPKPLLSPLLLWSRLLRALHGLCE